MADASNTPSGLRQLQPRQGQRVEPPPPVKLSVGPARANNAKAACEECRRRKCRCSGTRPVCHNCARAGLECVYTTAVSESRTGALKRKLAQVEQEMMEAKDSSNVLRQLFKFMRHSSEADTNEMVRLLRGGTDEKTIVRHVEAGDLHTQLHLKPETRFRFEFPHGSKTPKALQATSSPYLSSQVYEAAFVMPVLKLQDAAYSDRPQYLRPLLSAKILDPRLNSIKPSAWTDVSSNDELMRELLHLYFMHEYHWATPFHKDHFLDDMVSGQTQFCSPLLVNAILAHACGARKSCADRAEYWNPESLGYRFFAETKRLWEVEQFEKASVTKVQAGIVINLVYNVYSMDKLSVSYRAQALNMAYELNMFGPPSEMHTTDKQLQVSYILTAWCLYFLSSLQSYHLLEHPMTKQAPLGGLPDPDQHGSWYGDFYLQYPMSDTLCPMHHGHLFKAKCELISILNAISMDFFERSSPRETESTSLLIDHYLARLNDWYKSLPPALHATEIVYPSQLKLHVIYQNVLIDLCQVDLNNLESDSRQTLLAEAKLSLEIIMRLYYLHHGYECADMYLTQGLMVLAFESLHRVASISNEVSLGSPGKQEELDDARSTLILAAKGLSDQGKNYYLPYTVFHMVQAKMSPEDINALYQMVEMRKEDRNATQLRSTYVKSEFPVNIVSLTEHPDSQRLINLVQEYGGAEGEEAEAAEVSGESGDEY